MRGTSPITQTDDEINFYSYFLAGNSHRNASVLLRETCGEGAYGLLIRNRNYVKSGGLTIETVENAESLIKALQTAIDAGWLFTEEEIDKYRHKCTDTRADLLRNKGYLEERERRTKCQS